MGNSSKVIKLLLAMGLTATLAGCGGGGGSGPSSGEATEDTSTSSDSSSSDSSNSSDPLSSSSGSSTDTDSNPASQYVVANTADTVRISQGPYEAAITDTEQGYYRRIVSVLVQDKDGNPVADGTPVYMDVIDSIIASGTLDTGANASNGISGTTLTNVGANFDQATVERNWAQRFIQAGDHILLIPEANEADGDPIASADEVDQVRVVASADGNVTTNTVTAATAYNSDYPNTTYPTDTTSYVIGASMLSAQVAGESQAGGESELTSGVSTTVNGTAHFRLTYLADTATINTGCTDAPDTRALPVGSAQPYLIAYANSEVVSIAPTCLSAIWGDEVTIGAFPNAVTLTPGASYSVEVFLLDGGNSVPVPFERIRAVADGDFIPWIGSSTGTELGDTTWLTQIDNYRDDLIALENAQTALENAQDALDAIDPADYPDQATYNAAYDAAEAALDTARIGVYETEDDVADSLVAINDQIELTNNNEGELTTDSNGYAYFSITVPYGVESGDSTVVTFQGMNHTATLSVGIF